MKKTIPDTSVHKVTATSGSIEAHDTKYGFYVRGYVSTPWGYVYAYSETGDPGHFVLACIFDGYKYTRSYPKYYTAKYLAGLAAKFAREVAET